MNPRCVQTQARLDEWLDDELTPAGRAEVTAHLAQCSECRAIFAPFDLLNRNLAGLSAAAERIADAPRSRRISRPFLAPLRIAAAIVILAATGLAIRTALLRHDAPPPLNPPIAPVVVASAANGATVITSTPAMAVKLLSNNPHVSIVMLYEPVRLPSQSPAESKPSL